MSHVIAIPYKALPSADLGNVTTTAKGFIDANSKAIVLPLMPSGHLKNKLFQVKAWGRANATVAVNFTASLYFGTSATVADDTLMKSSDATALASIKHSWFMIADLSWDATSNKIQGAVYFTIAEVITALAATTVISSADPTDDTARGFIISGLFSTSSTGNAAFLDGFQIEVD